MKKIIVGILVVVSFSLGDSLTIKGSFDKALKYEANLQSNIYQTKAKKEEIDQAKSALMPKIDLQISGTTRNYTINYNGLKRDERYYTATLSGQLPIYHPENYNYIDQAKLKYGFSHLYVTQLKEELAYNVTDAFMQIVRAKNSLSVAKAYLEANRVKYNQIKKKFDKRLANKMDLLEAKVVYERSKVKVVSEMRNLSLAKYKLKNLTGFVKIKVPVINLEDIYISSLDTSFGKRKLQASNLEIKKSEVRIKLVKKEIKNASYRRYPKVDLSASISKYDSKNNFTDYTRESRVILSVKMPLFDGGYTSSRVAQFRYLLSSAQEELKNTQRKIVSQYEEFMVKLKTAKDNISLYKENIKSSKLYLYSVNRGYEAGLKDLIDVEDAKAKLYEAKFKLIDSVYQFIKSYTSLLQLYGELSSKKLSQLDHVIFYRY